MRTGAVGRGGVVVSLIGHKEKKRSSVRGGVSKTSHTSQDPAGVGCFRHAAMLPPSPPSCRHEMNVGKQIGGETNAKYCTTREPSELPPGNSIGHRSDGARRCLARLILGSVTNDHLLSLEFLTSTLAENSTGIAFNSPCPSLSFDKADSNPSQS